MPLAGPPVPSHLVGQSFVKCAFDKLKEYRKSVFLIDESTNKQYTYENVLQMSTSIAVKLQKLGIRENVVVSSLIDNNVEAISFQLGLWFSGGTSNPVNHFQTSAEVRANIMISRPAIIFCGNQYLSMVEESIKNIGWDITIITKHKEPQYLSFDELLNEDVSKFSVTIDDPANHIPVVLFTSGTTGVPKAVKIKDSTMIVFPTAASLDKSTRTLLTSPMFWVSNCFVITKTIFCNKTFILPTQTDAEGLLKCIDKLKPGFWFTSSSPLLEMCLLPNLHEYDTSSIKYIFMGGSFTSTDHKHLICKKVFNNRNILLSGYGSTEVGIVSQNFKELPVNTRMYEGVGQISHGVTLKIVDLTSGKELGPGEDGEICVKSHCFMAGYMNKDLENTELDSEGWWHMGDIGHYDESGYLYFTSRLKEIMKFRGVQIAPAELEKILYKHPDVIEACVVGMQHDIDGEWPTAFVIKQSNSSLTEKELCKLVEENVADSKRLRGGVHFVSSLPKNAVGKVVRKELLKSCNT
ncbi:4-coumarate--CoA ligase 1-like [Cimex lectularius]|uniref:Luciferin 4-monooxygenase n=1 Tax=Cimex lectularius TaxID=79782 RepID=A0A8I6THA4_CIMLE|nr:4-coumarate--CoA ligase 1-like [Cimex lectularius]